MCPEYQRTYYVMSGSVYFLPDQATTTGCTKLRITTSSFTLKLCIQYTRAMACKFSLSYLSSNSTSKIWSHRRKFTGCEQRVISKFLILKCYVCMVRASEETWGACTHSVKYSFSEVPIQWSTHSVKYSSVKYSFSGVVIQWSNHSVKLETAWVGI